MINEISYDEFNKLTVYERETYYKLLIHCLKNWKKGLKGENNDRKKN